MTELRSYMRHAQIAAQVIDYVMVQDLHLVPPSNYTLTRWNGYVWLVASVDTLGLGGKIEAYEDDNVAHQLSTALSEVFGTRQPIEVVVANHTGLRYCILFGKKPTLPRRVEFPGFGQRDIFRLGIGMNGEVSLKAAMMKNVIIGASQESGKSNVLRLITHQARVFGWSLYLADSQAHTFNPDAWNPIARYPVACTVDELLALLERLIADLEDRSVRFRVLANGGIPAADLDAYNNIATDPLPRILLAIDEASTPLQDKRVFKKVGALLRDGRKWGLHIVMAGHEWHKDVIPAEINDVLQTRIALPMIDENSGYVVTRNHSWGKWVVGKPVGRGVLRTNHYTPMQFYLVTDEQEAEWLSPAAQISSPLSVEEQELVRVAIQQFSGTFPVKRLAEAVTTVTAWQIRNIAEKWELRGWLEKPKDAVSSRQVTARLAELAGLSLTGAQAAQALTGLSQALTGTAQASDDPQKPLAA